MKSVSQIRSKEELEELKEVLSKVASGDVVVSLKRVVTTVSGKTSKFDEQTATIEGARTLININADEGLLYIHIKAPEKASLKRVVFWFDTVLSRATECFKQSKPLDLFLVLDVVRQQLEKSVVYDFSINSPVFIWLDDDTLRLAVPIGKAYFEKADVTIEQVEYAMELLEEYEDEEDEDWKNSGGAEDILRYDDTL